MSKAGKIPSCIVIFSFVIGIILMAISEHVDSVFFTGLGLFLLGVAILVVSMIWNIAGWMDRQAKKYFD